LTLSFKEICNKANQSSEDKIEEIIRTMVTDGQANALISRKDMTVNFLEGEE
jgi:hypothetical protein